VPVMEEAVQKTKSLAGSEHKAAAKQAWVSSRWRPELDTEGNLGNKRTPVIWLALLLCLVGVFSLWFDCGNFQLYILHL